MMFALSMPFGVFQIFNIRLVYYINKDNILCLKKKSQRKSSYCYGSKKKVYNRERETEREREALSSLSPK